jgi:hypothetical protein
VRTTTFLLLNVALVLMLAWGVARHHRLSARRVWWWFPLVLGFAPFLEVLNMITAAGIFLLFVAQTSLPLLAGVGLAIAVVTKLSPIVLLGIVVVNRHLRVAWASLGALVGNAHSLVAKLGYGGSPGLLALLALLPATLHDQVTTLLQFYAAQPQRVQLVLTLYLGFVLLVSATLARATKRDAALFVVACLATAVLPNVMWYHHYVFLLLPLLVWMASSGLSPMVVAWCAGGLTLVQIDRWDLTQGFLIHCFVHASIVAIIVGQIRLWFSSAPMSNRSQVFRHSG